jgi:hypothetical protein
MIAVSAQEFLASKQSFSPTIYSMESNDLNKLRRRPERQLTKSVDEQIAELRGEIDELERKANDPSELTKFLCLDPTAQKEKLNRINSDLEAQEQYTIDEYVAELREAEQDPSLVRLRLRAAKLKLEKLIEASKSQQ